MVWDTVRIWIELQKMGGTWDLELIYIIPKNCDWYSIMIIREYTIQQHCNNTIKDVFGR